MMNFRRDMQKALFWAGCFFCALAPVPSAPAAEEDALKTLTEAQQQLEAMDFKKSEKAFAKVLTQTKDNATKCKAYAGQAKSILNQYNPKKALETYLLVFGCMSPPSNPPKADDNKDAWQAVQDAYETAERNLKDPKAMRKVCQKAIDCKVIPQDKLVEYYLRMIRSFDLENLPKDMNKWVEKGLAIPNLDDKNKYRLLTSAGHLFLWNWEDGKAIDQKRARELFTQAQALPNLSIQQQAELFIWVGDSYHHEQNYAASRAEYAKTLALEKLPENSHMRYWALKNTGWTYKRENNKPEARKFFEQALKIADAAHNETWRKECDDGLKGL